MVLGITGGIGSGKTTVSKLFSLFGIPVYIADVESKKITEESPVIKEKLISLFGRELYANRTLDKKLLASIIFKDKSKLELVNDIIHPEVQEDLKNWCSINLTQHSIVAVESAILYESGFDKFVDKIVMVYAPIEDRIIRVIDRDKNTRQQVLDRINNQMSDEIKAEKADFIIMNNNEISLIAQIENLLIDLKSNSN